MSLVSSRRSPYMFLFPRPTSRRCGSSSPAMRTSLFFFFSSRRRHTRFKCDWSSDVCSSDLSRRCIRASRRPHAARASRRSRSGSRRSPRPRSRTPAASPRVSRPWASERMNVTADAGSPEASAPAVLAAEAKRVYDICAGCRRCYNLCPSFNYLLDTADEQHDGDGAALTPAEDRRVVELCFGCNLCYPHCPYTPPHRWAVDFPRLMQDARIARAAGEGIRLRDRILGNPELLGRLGSALPRLANWANRNRWLRWGMEKALGIDRRRRLPRYAPRFRRRVRRQAPPPRPG